MAATAVVYQIYPRSFADSDGDGVGDLPGHHRPPRPPRPDGLGVDAIWLSPIYPSPGLDVGYDVSDHARVDPLFGTEADFDRLVAEAHRRGHPGDPRPGHEPHERPAPLVRGSSRQSRDDPYADWYLWRDPAGSGRDGQPLPPNNWVSFFGGPGWTWEPRRGQFYHHTFLAEQPDLDWRDAGRRGRPVGDGPGLARRGASTASGSTSSTSSSSTPTCRRTRSGGARPRGRARSTSTTATSPTSPDLLGRFRAIVDDEPGRMTVGELFDGTARARPRPDRGATTSSSTGS